MTFRSRNLRKNLDVRQNAAEVYPINSPFVKVARKIDIKNQTKFGEKLYILFFAKNFFAIFEKLRVFKSAKFFVGLFTG